MRTLTVQELALYLGCEVQAVVQPFHQLDMIGTLNEVSTNGTVILYNSDEGMVEWNSDYIKPILRPLSDITEEEMKELYLLVFKRQFVGNNITHRDIGKKEERWVLWSGVERLFIYKDGDIGADSDLNHYKVHTPTVLLWQISKGFDLFNWIQQGLAIDATKQEVKP